MDNMADNGSLHSEEEIQWFDIMVRRPNDSNAHRRARELLRRNICPIEVFTSTYSQAGREDDIKLVLKGFQGDSDQAMLSSGLTEWDSSDVLCNYLITHNTGKKERRLLELGSGLGKCGLLAHHLIQSNNMRTNYKSSVFTDGDTNVLQLLRNNVVLNTSSDDDNISCQQLKWGKREAKTFLLQQNDDKFDLIIGSELIYTNHRSIDPLFDTVYELLDDKGRFILAHNEEHLVSLKWVKSSASERDLFCEVLRQEGQVHLLCFRRLGLQTLVLNDSPYLNPNDSRSVIQRVNNMADRLHAKNTLLEDENRALKARLQLVEDKCLKLDERCTTLRGDEDLPTSILLSFDEDNLASILSFSEPQDFASLEATCKYFGLGTHIIGDEHVSLIKNIAYNFYESASPLEKEALSLQAGYSPLYIYNELIQLRMSLKFDQLFGYIQHANGDKSTVEPLSMRGRIKEAHSIATGRSYRAFTAVSDHVMRAGKHYVTFTCSSGINQASDQPNWFGIVRPMKRFTPLGYIRRSTNEITTWTKGLFTPFDGIQISELRELQCSEWGNSNTHACVYQTINGHCKSTDWGFNNSVNSIPKVTNKAWEGMQSFDGGKIGLLLDYDEGTLTVYKDDIRLGVLKEGLSGAYCWMVTVGMSWGRHSQELGRIKIERSPLPEDNLELL